MMKRSDSALGFWGVVAEGGPLLKSDLHLARSGSSYREAIVFIHGIYSNHKTFESTRAQISINENLFGTELYYFDYNFRRPMEENGRALSDMLKKEFDENDRVAIVAHSMGGLVARFAILLERLNFLKLLFLLGTPNTGTLRLSQLTALGQLVHGTTAAFFSQFPRHSGVPSLTRAAELIDNLRGNFSNAIGIDYVSIPGKFYHSQRSIWERPKTSAGAAFSGVQAALFLLLLGNLGRPHDGIVDESSNNISKSVRSTEKTYSYGGTRGERPPTYAHLVMEACNELNHVELHIDPRVVGIVSHMVAAKFHDPWFNLESWARGHGQATINNLGITIDFGNPTNR